MGDTSENMNQSVTETREMMILGFMRTTVLAETLDGVGGQIVYCMC